MNYYVLHKPYGYLSQFTPEGKWKGLGELHQFPKDVYAVGRLDADSEGLLLLTNDKSINHLLLNPKFKHKRIYSAEVEGIPELDQLVLFETGMPLNYKGKVVYTSPARAVQVQSTSWLETRNPPIRVRKNSPTSWLELELTEGKNRQVRKMTAHVGLPTLRLIRSGIEGFQIEDYPQGSVTEISNEEFYEKCNLITP